jgi:hypothetical protein
MSNRVPREHDAGENLACWIVITELCIFLPVTLCHLVIDRRTPENESSSRNIEIRLCHP